MIKRNSKPREILLSKRANIFYIEHCRIMQKDGRLIVLGDTGKEVEHYYNLPDRNTMFLLLGIGTSITNSAARRLAESNVVFGFVGNGGSPVFTMSDFVFMPTLSEYRPTEYMQKWVKLFFNEDKRLDVAKDLLLKRLDLVVTKWGENQGLSLAIKSYQNEIEQCLNNNLLLLTEAKVTKFLYKQLAIKHGITFKRDAGKDNTVINESSLINGMLDQGNYIAYGFAASALHVMGISYAFPVLHGKTRRGGLVFDIADLIKDAYVMPHAFECGISGETNQFFRDTLIENLNKGKVMDFMINFIVKTLDRATH